MSVPTADADRDAPCRRTGVIADFYHAPDDACPPRWLGSLQGGEIVPDALTGVRCGRAMLEATDLKDFLDAVSDLLELWADNDSTTAYPPADGWRWPWDDDRHADWTYTFDGNRVWVAHRLATRETTTAALTPDPDEALVPRATILLNLAAETTPTIEASPIGPDQPTLQRCRFDMVERYVARAASRTRRLSDFEVADLAFALSNNLIRDCCQSFAVGEHAEAAEKLWMELLIASPRQVRANPAALLAMSAFIRGDHRLADAALTHIEDTAPGHPLVKLLRPGSPHVSREDMWRTAEGSRRLVQYL